MTLQVRRLDDRAQLPTRAYPGDAGLDLYALDDGVLAPGERASIRTGIAIVNAPGLIDSGYRGEVRVLLLNTDRAASFTFSSGERIAQLVLVRIETPEIVEVEALATSERGAGGFGSSG
jgi:dUTP pyrophosphatase